MLVILGYSQQQNAVGCQSLGLGVVRILSPASSSLQPWVLCVGTLPWNHFVLSSATLERWNPGCCHLGSLSVQNAALEPLSLGTLGEVEAKRAEAFGGWWLSCFAR